MDGEIFELPDRYNPTLPYGVDRYFFYSLKKKFVKNGHSIGTIDQISIEGADLVIFIDIQDIFKYYFNAINQSPRPHMILLIREPPSFEPSHSHKIITKISTQFDCVLTWMDDFGAVSNIKPVTLPISPRQLSFSSSSKVTSYDERDLLVNISSNKMSSHPEELYSERERVIKFYNEYHPEKFGLYGVGWNDNYTPGKIAYGRWTEESYSFYYGSTSRKSRIYDKYKFALAFENIAGLNGYVSEKVFDVFTSGRIPIYWGASNIDEYLPKKSYIDYRKFAHPHLLHRYISEMTRTEYEDRLEIIKKFLSNESEKFRADNVASDAYNHIIDACKDNTEICNTNYMRELERINKYNTSVVPQIAEQSIRALINPPSNHSRRYVLERILASVGNYIQQSGIQ